MQVNFPFSHKRTSSATFEWVGKVMRFKIGMVTEHPDMFQNSKLCIWIWDFMPASPYLILLAPLQPAIHENMPDGGSRSLPELQLSPGSHWCTHSLIPGLQLQCWVCSTLAWGTKSLARFLSWRAGAWSFPLAQALPQSQSTPLEGKWHPRDLHYQDPTHCLNPLDTMAVQLLTEMYWSLIHCFYSGVNPPGALRSLLMPLSFLAQNKRPCKPAN